MLSHRPVWGRLLWITNSFVVQTFGDIYVMLSCVSSFVKSFQKMIKFGSFSIDLRSFCCGLSVFPVSQFVVRLFSGRYLVLICNGEVNTAMFKLWFFSSSGCSWPEITSQFGWWYLSQGSRILTIPKPPTKFVTMNNYTSNMFIMVLRQNLSWIISTAD